MTHRSAWLAVVSLWLLPQAVAGQYFGQNQVKYRTFDFSIVETAHFDVYYYDDVRDAALDAARMAERAYARLARLLRHEYRERQPIVLFGSHTEFQQNNLIDIAEGVQGVTDPFRHRVMLPFTGSYEEFEHVLQHELVHQFQFDVFARGHVGAAVGQLMLVQPPLWFTEGMAEYLSLGPVNALTAMWLRDAAQTDRLPTIQQLTEDPNIFPYRYGHALLSYIGERWGDDAVAGLLHNVANSGLEAGFARTVRMPLAQLSREWQQAVRNEYSAAPPTAALPEPAVPILTEDRSGGRVHVSPALSPDGQQVAYFSEGGSLFISLYLADVASGRRVRRLAKSAFSADLESLRFLTSTGSWSPDGRFFAFAAKHGGRDDIVIFDVVHNRIHRRIRVPVAGVTNPAWSPHGNQLVFTGLAGGVSDLFIVNVDGSGLRRLTDDRYAALHPAWSPDGRTIAFVTDRGPLADFSELHPGPLAIALLHLDTEVIELLPAMEGANVNPQWSPDGAALAFVSDRTGVANVFLHDLESGFTYQLTDVFTGVSGITGTSPAISWAPAADRLAVTYYEDGQYNVYGIDDPRSLEGEPYRSATHVVAAAAGEEDGQRAAGDDERLSSADYIQRRFLQYLDRSGSLSRTSDRRRAAKDADDPTRPSLTSVRALLDSALRELPDTADFGFRRYTPTLQVDYVVQPTIGYQRDNFGSGVFGGTAVSLSDLLGNRRVLLGGQVNGRIEEAQILAVYANTAHRTGWAVGYEQMPTFYYEGSDITTDPSTGLQLLNQRIRRFILHRAFLETNRPFSRFERLEARIGVANVSDARLDYQTLYDPSRGYWLNRDVLKSSRGSKNYMQPSLALVYDNSVSLWVGPFAGRRSRFEYSAAIGEWSFHQALADYRRYDQVLGPVTLATRLFFFGRFGRDSYQFPVYLGTPDLLRGYTSGSYRRRECDVDDTGFDGTCNQLNQLVGTRLGVVNAELRFPILNRLVFRSLPAALPPLEGALFFDAGIAWEDGSSFAVRHEAGDDYDAVRAPLASWGVSLRTNLLGFLMLRGDFAKPLSRVRDGAYWTISLGPMF